MERLGKCLIILIITVGLIGFASAQIGFDNPNLPRIESVSKILESFLNLLDTPPSFAGEGGQCVIVNGAETGLAFGNCSNATGGGGSGDITSVFGDEWITNGSVTGDVNLVFNRSNLDSLNYQNASQVNASIISKVTQSFIQALGFLTGSDVGSAITGNRTASEAALRVDIDGNFTTLNDTITGVNTTTNIEALGFVQGAHINDTNASSICSGDEVLLGNGSCQSSSGFSTTLNDGLFVNYTLTTTTGNITNGSLVGYAAADNICNVEVSAGSHMCQIYEIINSIRLVGINNFTATFRVSEGAPGFTANANDCVGWRDDDGTFLGSIWVGNNDTGGQGALVACNAERAIGCCL